MEFILVPQPRNITYKAGKLTLQNLMPIWTDSDFDALFFTMRRLKDICAEQAGVMLMLSKKRYAEGIRFLYDNNLKEQEYRINCDKKGIEIRYHEACGAFYGVSTLKQIITQRGSDIPCFEISDYPDFHHRGMMFDISRGKIPTLETLLRQIDLLSDLKYNELQLYIEGCPFAFESKKEFWVNETPLTGEEFLIIDRYCRERFIEFVPNLNTFGHNAYWLAQPQFNHLAECPEGFEMHDGRHASPMTLCPTDDSVIPFMDTLLYDLLPYFSSKKLNVGCDETYECGKGRSAQAAPDKTAADIYVDYIRKIHTLAGKYGKQVMMWGDIILQHPEKIEELPKDIIVLDWGYEERQDFVESSVKFKNAGLQYYVCPGTSGWCGIGGLAPKNEINQANAARNGIKNGATGYLLTDWLDNNFNMNYVVHPAVVYGGGVSWCFEKNEKLDYAPYLNQFIFHDQSGQAARLARLLSGIYRHFHTFIWNSTWSMYVLSEYWDAKKELGMDAAFTAEECQAALQETENYLKGLEALKLTGKEAELLYTEMRFTGELLQNIILYAMLRKRIGQGEDKDQYRPLALEIKVWFDGNIPLYRELWLLKNKESGLTCSAARLNTITKYIDYIYSL